MKKFLVLSAILYGFMFSVPAVEPTGYYNSIEGKKAAALKTALHTIICQDTTHYLDYGSGAGKTWEGFYYTDRNLTTNAVVDMYSDSVRYFPNPNPDFVSFGQVIHIEHSVPKSWWGCDITHPDCPAKDLHHLYPADGPANSSKNDNPLGVVSGTPSYNNGVSKVGPGNYPGYVGAVFEPADQYKGDFARSYFYMATAYEHYARKWDTSKPENMMEHNTYPVLKPWAIQLLLDWSRKDPVSGKEITRDEVVYGIQKNRNPYIDHPELIEYIWGNKTTIPYLLSGNVDFPYLNYPNNEDTVQFGTVYFDQTVNMTVNLKAMNLSGDLSVALSGINTSDFAVDKTILTKAEAEAGTSLMLQFAAQTTGVRTAQLTVSGGGITPVIIYLKAIASDDFVALPASNISSTGFSANWTASASATGYSVDVYKLEPNGVINPVSILEENFLLTVPAGWIKEGYTDNSLADFVKLASTTNYGKLTLPALDLSVSPAVLTVGAKQYSNDTGAKLTATLDNQPLAIWTTGIANQDFTVTIPKGNITSSITLSAIAGKRVYIDYIKAESQVAVKLPVSVQTYPKSVLKILSYPIDGLVSDSTYYYTITPQGNSGIKSNQIKVQTGIISAVKEPVTKAIYWSQSASGVEVHNLPTACTLHVLDLMGKKIQTLNPVSSSILLTFPQKGLYLLQIQQNNTRRTYKIIN